MNFAAILGPLAVVAVLLLAVYARHLYVHNGMRTIVYEWEYGLRYVDGRFDRLLPPGRHPEPLFSRHDVYRLRRNDQFEQVGPVDVVSADRLVFRLTAVICYRITDPQAAFEGDYHQSLRIAVTGALQALAAERTVEDLLGGRKGLDETLKALLPDVVCGCTLQAAGIAAIVLPPELRRLFSEVERARLEGQAALERARGEQAALRALGNAARMLKDNPELQNLRLLQVLSGSGRSQPTVVLGEGALKPGTAAPAGRPDPTIA
ncbi:SPFH domain-containing protein [Phreatobacter sp.]|uniref:SPFH domain-containing protein n=1 Tax=Phreatobacter sp. TaxID=1966341 RepID=UPI003F70AA72